MLTVSRGTRTLAEMQPFIPILGNHSLLPVYYKLGLGCFTVDLNPSIFCAESDSHLFAVDV
jgi:hypothetical protein